MEKEITIRDTKYIVKEIKYKDFVSSCTSLDQSNPSEINKQLLMVATGITENDYDELSLSAGLTLTKAVNEVNGMVDFRKPETGQSA